MSEPGGLPTLERLRAALSSQPSVLAEVDAMVAKGDMTEKEIVSNVISKAKRNTVAAAAAKAAAASAAKSNNNARPSMPVASTSSTPFDHRLAGYSKEAFKVPLMPSNTRFEGLSEEDALPPALSAHEQKQMLHWMQQDQAYDKVLTRQRGTLKRKLEDMKSNADQGLDARGYPMSDWLGHNALSHPETIQTAQQTFRAKHPPERQEEIVKGKKGRLRGGIVDAAQKAYWVKMADEDELLVPIRIDTEQDGYKIRDTFTWNIKDERTDKKAFAAHLIADFQLPPSTFNFFLQDISMAINEQVTDAKTIVENNVYSVSREDCERASRSIKLEAPYTQAGARSTSFPDLKNSLTAVHEELRILVKLDITLGSMNLVDQIEWDISDPRNSPEEFAQQLAVDLGLPGEFTTAIAHSIREQTDSHTKSLSLIDHVPGQPIVHEELKSAFLPALSDYTPQAIRSAGMVHKYTPRLERLSQDDLERGEHSRDRTMRVKRRQTKGRQRVAIPDREALKTHRSILPRPGGVPPTPVYNKDGDLISTQPETAEPYTIVFRPDHEYRTEPKYKPPRDPNDALYDTVEVKPVKKPPPVERAYPKPEEVGQHECYIDGKFHCANCGGPEGIVPGRRKGPSGEKTLCSQCGKFWARYKKNRPCEYTTDPGRHISFQKAEEQAARLADDMPQPSHRKLVKQQSPDPKPMHQKLVIKRRDSSPPVPLANQATPEFSRKKMQPPPPASSSPFARLGDLPPWLRNAMIALKNDRPEDRFEIIPRSKADPTAPTEYRIKCLDCPGKLYVPGPGESLQNFDIHVKNRNHRTNVDTRLGRTG